MKENKNKMIGKIDALLLLNEIVNFEMIKPYVELEVKYPPVQWTKQASILNNFQVTRIWF